MNYRKGRRSLCGIGLLLTLLLSTVYGPGTKSPARADVLKGAWSAPFAIGIQAVHTVVLPNSKVLMISRPRLDKPTAERLFDPATKQTMDVAHPDPERDFYCSGPSLLTNGRAYLTGGNLQLTGKIGVRGTDLFNPSTNSWSNGPLLSEPRWYPTNAQLPNGEVLIMGGWANPKTWSNTVDKYNPASNTLTRLPATATQKIGLYPRIHLLPSGKLFYSGVTTDPLASVSKLFDPATNTWSTVDTLNFGPRGDGISVLLPGQNKVLAFGGSQQEVGNATASAELIDLSGSNPQWEFTTPMNLARKEGSSVVLPDGTVLAVGGARGPGAYENPVKTAELFDPVTKTWTVMATQAAVRAHHSTAVLLPDGRVLSAGGDRGTLQKTAEIFSPPYLFKGPRPVISSSPSQVSYGTKFNVTSPNAGEVSKVALIRSPSTTHSTVFDQRYLSLPFTRSGDNLAVDSPPSSRDAPPGYYMLFILNSEGVPSTAGWVKVG